MVDKEVYNKLADFCAYQERCAADVKQKLQKLKAGKEHFGDYLQKLKEENFLNEERYAKHFVAGHAKKKWGKTKIKMALLRKGIDPVIVSQYLNDLDDEGYEEQIKTAAEKRWGTIRGKTVRDKKTKLLRFLLSKGYEMNKILRAMKELNI